MTIYFWSDLHIGHVNLAEKWRTWASQGDIDQYNEWVRDTWNHRVKPSDDVVVVGDACMGNLQESLEFAKTLNGHKYLIPGNHDRVHPYYLAKHKPNEQKVAKWEHDYRKVFELRPISENLRYSYTPSMAATNVVLNHFPWAEDVLVREGVEDPREEDRMQFSFYRDRMHYATVLVHGHTHHPGIFDSGPRSVHIGVDAHRDGPVSLDHLLELVDQARSLEWPDQKDALAT